MVRGHAGFLGVYPARDVHPPAGTHTGNARTAATRRAKTSSASTMFLSSAPSWQRIGAAVTMMWTQLSVSSPRGLPSDSKWLSQQTDMGNNNQRSNLTVLAICSPCDVLPCATPLPVGVDVRDSTDSDPTRTKRSADMFIADEGSEHRPDKRTSILHPVSKYHPVPRPGVLNGTGYEVADIYRFVLEAENLIGEPGKWVNLFVPIVEACRLWNRGGPLHSVSFRTNFRNNTSALTARVRYANTH
jgi:hypothetical protein